MAKEGVGVATVTKSPILIFKEMVINNPAVRALRRPGRVALDELLPPRTGNLRFRAGQDIYGTLSAIKRDDDCFRFTNVNKGLDAIFHIRKLLEILEVGQTARVILSFQSGKSVSIRRDDLKSLLVKTGVLKGPKPKG